MSGRSRPARRLTGLRLDGGTVPARGTRVFDAAGGAVGSVTSACLAPTRGTIVGLAMLSVDASAPLSVDGEHAQSVPLPFYDPERRRARARPSARPAGVA